MARKKGRALLVLLLLATVLTALSNEQVSHRVHSVKWNSEKCAVVSIHVGLCPSQTSASPCVVFFQEQGGATEMEEGAGQRYSYQESRLHAQAGGDTASGEEEKAAQAQNAGGSYAAGEEQHNEVLEPQDEQAAVQHSSPRPLENNLHASLEAAAQRKIKLLTKDDIKSM